MISMIKKAKILNRPWLLSIVGGFFLLVSVFLLYVGLVLQTVSLRMDQLKSERPTVFYGVFPPLKKGDFFKQAQIETLLADVGFRKSRSLQGLPEGEFAWEGSGGADKSLLLHRPAFEGAGRNLEQVKVRVALIETHSGMLQVGIS